MHPVYLHKYKNDGDVWVVWVYLYFFSLFFFLKKEKKKKVGIDPYIPVTAFFLNAIKGLQAKIR